MIFDLINTASVGDAYLLVIPKGDAILLAIAYTLLVALVMVVANRPQPTPRANLWEGAERTRAAVTIRKPEQRR